MLLKKLWLKKKNSYITASQLAPKHQAYLDCHYQRENCDAIAFLCSIQSVKSTQSAYAWFVHCSLQSTRTEVMVFEGYDDSTTYEKSFVWNPSLSQSFARQWPSHQYFNRSRQYPRYDQNEDISRANLTFSIFDINVTLECMGKWEIRSVTSQQYICHTFIQTRE